MPENSIPGFLKALEFSRVRTLELDLAVSRDGQLIVSHEPWFNPDICRLVNGEAIQDGEDLLIYQLTAAQLRAFDCGGNGNAKYPEQQKVQVWKPTLEETVAAVREKYPDKSVRWNLEIKSNPDWDGVRTPPIDSFAHLVIREIERLGLKGQCNVQSFDVRPLQIIRKISPDQTLALLIENLRGVDANLNALGFTPDIYSPYYQLLSEKTIRICREKGMKIIPWTVNDPEDMRKLIRLGVDGIITDYPDRIPI
jgi:glycerophosphoryl diester phosphodiesterase